MTDPAAEHEHGDACESCILPERLDSCRVWTSAGGDEAGVYCAACNVDSPHLDWNLRDYIAWCQAHRCPDPWES